MTIKSHRGAIKLINYVDNLIESNKIIITRDNILRCQRVMWKMRRWWKMMMRIYACMYITECEIFDFLELDSCHFCKSSSVQMCYLIHDLHTRSWNIEKLGVNTLQHAIPATYVPRLWIILHSRMVHATDVYAYSWVTHIPSCDIRDPRVHAARAVLRRLKRTSYER